MEIIRSSKKTRITLDIKYLQNYILVFCIKKEKIAPVGMRNAMFLGISKYAS